VRTCNSRSWVRIMSIGPIAGVGVSGVSQSVCKPDILFFHSLELDSY
jgi:hypothetical protein